MALSFVKGKPVKVVEPTIDKPVPSSTPAENAAFEKQNADYLLKMKKDVEAKVKVAVDQTVAPIPSDTAKMPIQALSSSFETLYGVDGTVMHVTHADGVKKKPIVSVKIQGNTFTHAVIDELHQTAQQGGSQVQELSPAQVSQQQEPQSLIATEEASSEVLTLVDEYVEIQRELNKVDVTPLLKRQEELKKKLQLIAKSDHFPSNKSVQLWGTHQNYVEFSPQVNSTKIVDKNGLIAAVGQEIFNVVASITLTEAKKLLSENELSHFTATVPGARTMKAVVLGTDPVSTED
jgi:hypothetical protein